MTKYAGYDTHYGGILRRVENDKNARKLERAAEPLIANEALRERYWFLDMEESD